MSEIVSFSASPTSERNPITQGGPTCLTTFVTNSLTIEAERNSHISRHTHPLDIGRDPIGATISSADFATQIAQKNVEAHDACILAGVEALMHGSNRGTRAAALRNASAASVLCVCGTWSWRMLETIWRLFLTR